MTESRRLKALGLETCRSKDACCFSNAGKFTKGFPKWVLMLDGIEVEFSGRRSGHAVIGRRLPTSRRRGVGWSGNCGRARTCSPSL